MDHYIIEMLVQLAVGTLSGVFAVELSAFIRNVRKSKKQPPKKIS